MEKIKELFVVYLLTFWMIGNIIWIIVVHGVANYLNMSWMDVEHAIRPFTFTPTLKEMYIEDLRRGEPRDLKYEKNIVIFK